MLKCGILLVIIFTNGCLTYWYPPDCLRMKPLGHFGRENSNGYCSPLKYVETPKEGCDKFDGCFTSRERRASYLVPRSTYGHNRFDLPPVYCGFLKKTGFDDVIKKYSSATCKIVVVTVVFGGYECLNSVPDNYQDPQICYIALVDKVTASDESFRESARGWELFVVDPLPYNTSRSDRVVRLLPHRLFPNIEYSLYVDGKVNLRYIDHPITLLNRYLNSSNRRYAFVTARHIYYKYGPISEFGVHLTPPGHKDKISIVKKQLDTYYCEGAELYREGMIDAAIIFRRNSDPCQQLLSCLWFNEVAIFSFRVQLSFYYVLEMLGLDRRRGFLKIVHFEYESDPNFGHKKCKRKSYQKNNTIDITIV